MKLKIMACAVLSTLILSTACSSKPKEETSRPLAEILQPAPEETYTIAQATQEEIKETPPAKKKAKSKKESKKKKKKSNK